MSSNSDERAADFESVKNRLAEIADTVDDENLSLDEALNLYEEAVALGLQASDLLETGIDEPEEEPAAKEEPAAQEEPENEAGADPASETNASDRA